jgi:hypothetical protein
MSVAAVLARMVRELFDLARGQALVHPSSFNCFRPRGPLSRYPVGAAICRLRSFSANFARALPSAARFIWRLVAGGSGGCTTSGKLATDGLGLSTKRREMCQQVEHLKLWRSNPVIGVSARLTPNRRISAPQAKHGIAQPLLQPCGSWCPRGWRCGYT